MLHFRVMISSSSSFSFIKNIVEKSNHEPNIENLTGVWTGWIVTCPVELVSDVQIYRIRETNVYMTVQMITFVPSTKLFTDVSAAQSTSPSCHPEALCCACLLKQIVSRTLTTGRRTRFRIVRSIGIARFWGYQFLLSMSTCFSDCQTLQKRHDVKLCICTAFRVRVETPAICWNSFRWNVGKDSRNSMYLTLCTSAAASQPSSTFLTEGK